MVTEELKQNIQRNLKSTLSYLSSSEEQKRYKSSVSFVHIPYELLAQWEGFSDLLKEERKWFCDLFTLEQIAALREFDKKVDEYCSDYSYEENPIPDVPEVLEKEDWQQLMVESKTLYERICEQDV